jgi:hypothetical protein
MGRNTRGHDVTKQLKVRLIVDNVFDKYLPDLPKGD